MPMAHIIFFGISVTSTAVGYFLSQTKYALDILMKTGMETCKPFSSPLLVKPSVLPNVVALFSQPQFYRSIVGVIQYLTITKPDLSVVVNCACQHMHNLSNVDSVVVKRILWYLKGTLSHGLHFNPGSFDLHCFSNAD